MMQGLPAIEQAIEAFSRFPGIGRKSAQRMIFHMIRRGQAESDQLIRVLESLRDRVGHCRRCHNLAEGELCWICENPRRSEELLCVLEEPADLLAMERAGIYTGQYHVLGGRLSPVDGLGPESLNLDSLEKRLGAGTVNELIIATNPTVEGEATAHFLAQMAEAHVQRITRLAHGIPMGGELEYLDESTLYQALSGRRAF